MRYTVVFEWDGRGPAISSGDEFLGGKPCVVVFADEVARLERIEAAVEQHTADLIRCADLLDEHAAFSKTADEIRLAADELRESFAVTA